MRLDVRTICVLKDHGGRLLLLKRSASKKLFPSLITGIGGKVELESGEGRDLAGSLFRELEEEVPQITKENISDLRLRLITHESRADEIVVLCWFTSLLNEPVTDMRCTEGELVWRSPNELDFSEMIPTAGPSIRFLTTLANDDIRIYDGIYKPLTRALMVN